MFITSWKTGDARLWQQALKIGAKIREENELSGVSVNVYHLSGDVSGEDVAMFVGASQVVRIDSPFGLAEKIRDPFATRPEAHETRAAKVRVLLIYV
jgi:hypothetical protein